MKLFKRPKDMLAEPLEQGIEQEVARRVTDADFVPAPYNPASAADTPTTPTGAAHSGAS